MSAPADLIGRSDDWWHGYRAGSEAMHAATCYATAAERDALQAELERLRQDTEQRIEDLRREFGRRFSPMERAYERARDGLRDVLADVRTALRHPERSRRLAAMADLDRRLGGPGATTGALLDATDPVTPNGEEVAGRG